MDGATSEAGRQRLAGVDLRAEAERFRLNNPGARARDVAVALSVSEAELVASRCGDGVTRLEGDWGDMLRALTALGEVMALTRNDHCVHEKHGVYDKISIGPGHGMVLNHDIDLRLFLSHWHFGFAVSEEVKSGLRHSLQFYDLDGNAVHKVYVTEKSDKPAYDALVEGFRAADQSPEMSVTPLPPRRPDRPDADIDIGNFHQHWRALQDTHDFFGMLSEFGVGRAQAMRLAEDEFAAPAPADTLRRMLSLAAERAVPIMCFVGNPGCIQIHTGPVHSLKAMGPWFNVLDPGFNLHLREDAIAHTWIVRKPTRDGIVTSMELFDPDGFCFAQFFGERKPGKTEREDWRALVDQLDTSGSR
jgi:putative hemin transport protein